MVYDVRPPVEELAAALRQDRLPVVAAGVVVAAEPDFVDAAEDAGADDVPDVVEAGLEAAVLPDEEASGPLAVGGL